MIFHFFFTKCIAGILTLIVVYEISIISTKMGRREATVSLRQVGSSNSEFIKLLTATKSIVYHVVNRFRELCTAKGRGGRPCSARTKKRVKVFARG